MAWQSALLVGAKVFGSQRLGKNKNSPLRRTTLRPISMFTKDQLAASRVFIVFVAGLAALGPLSIDMYLPTLPNMAANFGVDIAAANLTVSTFMVGMAFGQFFGGPLSDQLGRKTVGLLGLGFFVVSTLAIIFAPSIEAVQILRTFQAMGGGFCSVICMAQARDVFPPEIVAKKFANIILVILLAPMIAPTFGALLAPWGWRAVFWVLIAYATLMATLYLSLIPETNEAKTGQLKFAKMFRGYIAAVTNRTEGRLLALRFAIFSGFSSGVLFTYVTNSSFIFIEYFKLSPFEFAATFGLLVAMMMSGNRFTAMMLGRIPAPRILSWANAMQITTAAIMVVICMLSEPGLWTILTGMSLLIISNGAISPAASGHYISLYTENIGSASSFNASMMFFFGALIGGLAAVLSGGELLPIFSVMLVSSLIARLVLISTR